MQASRTKEIAAIVAIVHRAIAKIEALPLRAGASLFGLSLRDMAERFYLERRMRDEHFQSGLFGEPAWDLLLALFVAHQDQKSLSLAEAFEAARIKPAAGRILIEKMEAERLVLRRGSGRSRVVDLTQHAVDRLSDYFLACLQERTDDGELG